MRGKVEGPFATAAEDYIRAGWMPIPVMPGSKAPAVRGFHGRNPYATKEIVRKWARNWSMANVAVRLPKCIIGIDVDHYSKKCGGDTLRVLERELGKLPRTYLVTSRSAPSGIRFFRVPENIDWQGHAGDDIDVISWYERYAIAWPSVHHVTGSEYGWFHERSCDGVARRVRVGIPSPDDMPELPEGWIAHLRAGDREDKRDVKQPAAREWIASHDGEMCEMMQITLDKWLERIQGGAHDAMVEGQKALCGDAADGHTGLTKALPIFREAFTNELSTRGRGRIQDGEWASALVGGVGYALTRPQKDEDGCVEVTELFGNFKPQRTSKVRSMDDVDDGVLEWVHYPMMPAGSLVIIDGDPSQGKSLLTLTMAARASRGRAILPWGESHLDGPIDTMLITTEDAPGMAMKPRLKAAKAVLSRIHVEIPWMDKRGNMRIMVLPDNASRVRELIADSGARLCIIDPITSFLGESINTSNDASVRRALGPLTAIAQETGCCIVIVRHMNKGGGDAKAMYRGGGSIAFSAIARSGLITGKLPDELGGAFGIAHVQCNYARPYEGTYSYSIESDEEGATGVPYIAWGDLHEDISADALVGTPKQKPGPDSTVQDEIEEILESMFDSRSIWTKQEVDTQLRNVMGRVPNKGTVAKVADKMGIRKSAIRGPNGVIGGSRWELRTAKMHL